MPKKIILVRHGETDFNKGFVIQGHLDVFLNLKGLEQAKEVSLKLEKEAIDYIFSSDLKRAFQTAIIIGQKLNKKIIKSKNLRERYLGDLEGFDGKDIKNRYGLEIAKRQFENKIPQSFLKEHFKVEIDEEIIKRFDKFFQKLVKDYANKNILLVSHGSVIRVFLKYFKIDKKIVENYYIGNTAILVLQKTKSGYKLRF